MAKTKKRTKKASDKEQTLSPDAFEAIMQGVAVRTIGATAYVHRDGVTLRDVDLRVTLATGAEITFRGARPVVTKEPTTAIMRLLLEKAGGITDADSHDELN